MKIVDTLAQIRNCQGSGCATNLPQVAADNAQFQKIFGILFGVVAVLAILTIVIASFNFATSDGDADKISRSKKAIILALIGLTIAVSAELIVQTVVGRLRSG